MATTASDVSLDDLLSAMTRLPVACPVESIGRELDVTEKRAIGLLEEAVGLGLVVAWPDGPAGFAVCLTPLATSRLGIEINYNGTRWLARGEPRHERRVRMSR